MGNWRYKKRSRMFRKRVRRMNFSYEEIYAMYGQYDAFVSLDFHIGSEAYNKYEKTLMGVFKYTLEQREELEKILKLKRIPFSSKRIPFEPSVLHDKLSEEQKIDLDKTGILNKDIACVSSMSKPRNNVFTQKGNKELPTPIEIKIDWSKKESFEVMLGLYKSRIEKGDEFCEIEMIDYYALRLYFEPTAILSEEQSFQDAHKDAIREKFLNCKWEIEGNLSDTEKTEIYSLLHSRWNSNRVALQNEIQQSGNNLDRLPIEIQMRLLTLSCSFENEILTFAKDKAIWWDIERFLHIYIRHIDELQPDGNFKNKTVFQYDFKDIRKVIIAVIEIAKEEIKAEFSANPTKKFSRYGKRAVYYNGNYYRVEIEPNGRLLTFHSYNDDKEREND